MWFGGKAMILPKPPASSSVSETKEDGSSILSAQTAETAIAIISGNKGTVVDKNSILTTQSQADAFNEAFSDLPESSKLWLSPGR